MACRTSIENLAAWAKIPSDSECRILEQVWQQQFQHDLATYYQIEDKLSFSVAGWALPSVKKLGNTLCQFLTS